MRADKSHRFMGFTVGNCVKIQYNLMLIYKQMNANPNMAMPMRGNIAVKYLIC